MIDMKVNIGVLKNGLSQYLNQVQKGQEITVTDRNQPIAKIIQLERPVMSVDFRDWLRKTPPLKPIRKQPSSGKFVRLVRDKE